MVDAARRSGRALAVGLVRRFFPATVAIRQLLVEEALGRVESFECSEGGVFRWPVRSASFFSRSTACGGVLLDIGPHVLDLLEWWFGPPADLCYEDDAMGGVEANCRIALRFPSGMAGSVRLSRDAPVPNRYTIDCEKGRLVWEPNDADGFRVVIHGADFRVEARSPEDEGIGFHASFLAQIRNVVAAVQGTRELAVDAERALSGLRLIERCYRTRSLMAMPWLTEAELAGINRMSHSGSAS